MKRSSLLTLLLVPGALSAFLACGSRGALDDINIIDVGKDAASVVDATTLTEGAAPLLDAATQPDVKDAADEKSQIDIVIDCAQCVNNNCADKFSACFGDPACASTLQCAVTTCLSGGQPDIGCVMGCANGDLAQLAAILGVVQCPLTKCKTECPDILSLLGGFLGGGGGGGTPPPPPPPPNPQPRAAQPADELVCSRARAALQSWPTFSDTLCKQR